MKKLLLFLISLCGVLTGCQRMPSEPVTYTPADTVEPGATLPDTLPLPDTVRQGPKRPPIEYKLLYGVRPTPYEQKRLAEDTLRER